MSVKTIREALTRLRSWLRKSLSRAGEFYSKGLTYRGLFKAPAGLSALGLHPEGSLTVDVLKKKFMLANGDFSEPAGIAEDKHPAPSLKFFYPYRTSWIAIGAQALGRHDVSKLTGEFVLSLQDEKTGGFADNLNTISSAFHLGGSAQAAMACCALGN